MDITMKNINVKINQKMIINDVSLTLKEQELVMLLGRNGSGKTTLMKTLVGGDQQREGTIYLGEKDMIMMSERERSQWIAYVPQTVLEVVNYTVEEYVLLGITPSMTFFQVPGKKELEQAKEVLQRFGLYEIRKQKLLTLSGGERQLTLLARARLQNTPWMVLDEPLGNLDYLRQHEFLSRLKQYQKECKQGIFMSVHDPNIALTYADTVVILHNQTIQKILHREEPQFEQQLLHVLNELYQAQLGLLKDGDTSLFYFLGSPSESELYTK